MAVQPQTPYKEYTANGSTKNFALEFDCENQDHLIVLVDGIEPVVGTWSLIGGAVVFGTAPTTGKKITIQRNTPFRRDGDFQSYDNSFRPGPVNKGFDWVWLKLQELGVADWILSNRIDALKAYVDDQDDELRAYLLEEIRKQGVALDQLDEYYNYLMQRLAQIAVDKGWDASFVVDGDKTQKQINDEQLVKNSNYDNLNAQNSLWQGAFSSFPMSYALTTLDVQRVQIPCGVTHARDDFNTGTTIYKVVGKVKKNALRIQRNATNTSTKSHNLVVNLTQEETREFLGKKCCFSFYAQRGANYSGVQIQFKVQCSREQEQPIVNSDATYTSGNEYLLNVPVIPLAPEVTKLTPFYFLVDVPADIVQFSLVLSIPFSGTAGTNDFVDVEGLAVTVSDKYVQYQDLSDELIKYLARSRYQSTYPYAAPRGTNTEQGAVNAVSVSTSVNWSAIMNVQFNPRFPIVPQFLFQSPTSGTESRLLNKDTGLNVNGLAFGLNDGGVTITNNAVVAAGQRFLCHWTAQIIF